MTAREATVAYMRALAENERLDLRLQKAARRAQEHANVMLQRASRRPAGDAEQRTPAQPDEGMTMATMNMTLEQAQQYHLATSGGAHPQSCSHPLPWRTSPVGYVCKACGQPTKRALSQAQVEVRAQEEQRFKVTGYGTSPITVTKAQFDAAKSDRLNPFYFAGVDYAKRDDRADALMYAMQAMPTAKCLGCGRTMGAPGSARVCGPCTEKAHAMPPAHVAPGPTLYDGLTAMQCYYRWGDNRACAERGAPLPYALTPAQIAAGRRAYQADALNEWSGELRAKVAASDAARKAREPSVLVQIEDD